MNKGIKRKLYFGLAASGLVYALGGSSAALAAAADLGILPRVPSDFDGDGRTDLAVIRPNTPADGRITWRALLGPLAPNVEWGLTTDIVVPGDYDGYGKTDQAVYRPENGNWFLLQSSAGFSARQWGISTDTPVPADYDGDGKTDLAVVRVEKGGVLNWFLLEQRRPILRPNLGTFDGYPGPRRLRS